MRRYKIQEVADMHNITKKALLYYDKIGLFSPEFIDETNNYRYYVRHQFPKLKQIIYLKKIGIPLDSIRDLLDHMTHEKYIALLSDKLVELEQDIIEMTKIKESISYLHSFYTDTQHIKEADLNLPMVKFFPERKICYQITENDASKEEIMLSYRKVLKYLDNNGMFSYKSYGTIYKQEGLLSEVHKYSGAFISVEDQFSYENEKKLPAGKYITMYKHGGYYDESNLRYFVEWIQNNGYEINGDVLDFCIVDYNFTQNEDLMIQELQVHVK